MSKDIATRAIKIKFKIFPKPKYLNKAKKVIDSDTIPPSRDEENIIEKRKSKERNNKMKKDKIANKPFGETKYTSMAMRRKRVIETISVKKKFFLFLTAFCRFDFLVCICRLVIS